MPTPQDFAQLRMCKLNVRKVVMLLTDAWSDSLLILDRTPLLEHPVVK